MNPGQLRVHLVSKWTLNPYQRLLVRELRAQGAIVSEDQPGIRRPLSGNRPHVIHLQNVRPYLTSGRTTLAFARTVGFALRLMLARAGGSRIVWTAHELANPSKARRADSLVTTVIARFADAIIVHTESGWSQLVNATRVRSGKVRIIPHGNYIGYYPDTVSRETARDRLGIRRNDVVFLHFGWMRKYKNAIALIRAFRLLEAEDTRLVIAGSAPEREHRNAIRAEADGDPRVLLHLDRIPDEDVQVYFNASDVAVLPYSHVLASGAMMLAHSFGKACIVANGSGLEHVGSRDGSFCYDGTGVIPLRSALEVALNNRDRIQRMGESNREAAIATDWSSVAQKTLKLYAEITNR